MKTLKILSIPIFLFFVSCGHLFAQEAILIVSLDVQPQDAIVFVDGKQTMVKDGRIETTAGKHQIRILKNGFNEIRDEIKVSRKHVYFNFVLTENPNKTYIEDEVVEEIHPATLKVATLEGATVLINDSLIPANTEMELPAQKAKILVFAEKTDTIEEHIELISGEFMELNIFPEPIVSSEDIKIEVVLVKTGSFVMGKPGSKSNARLHKVELDDYYISKYEVTQKLWEMIMKENPSRRQGEELPVENVSWEEVQKFIKKLNQITSSNYRLPTEAEWEYAARGGHQSKSETKYSGNDSIEMIAWYWKNSGDEFLEGRWDPELLKQNNNQIQRVGQLEPNELGIFDMTGNVWEWCSDWYGEEYYLSSPRSNPKGPKTGKTKVCRGGSYLSKASYCRNGFRFSYPPQNSYNYLGFRLVLEK